MDPPIARKVASKNCHSCRRRRLLCDRAYPHCAKCVSRGVECLGYGTMLLWTGAVATRGKLAGQPSTASLCRPEGQKPRRARSQGAIHRPETPERGSNAATESVPVSRGQIDSGSDTDRLSDTLVRRTLTDPLFQDPGHSYKRYFDYFSSRVCLDLVGHDFSGRNPFRTLLPLTATHPLLQHIVVATSAAHMSNQARCWISPTSLERREAPKPIVMDALIAKQKALQLMPSAIHNIASIGPDVVLAAALFLVNIELLESGKHAWKPHLEGATRIMSLMQAFPPVDESLRDYVMSDCIVYSILSFSLNPYPCDPQSYLQTTKAVAVLEKTENSYFCCPPDLLDVLLLTSQVANPDPERAPSNTVRRTTGAALLERAQNVDIFSWACRINEPDAVASRVLAASAHQLSTCLYVLQALPSLADHAGDRSFQELVDALYKVLSQIPDADPNFKATVWPTFILGTIAKTTEKHAWVMDRLRRLAVAFPWGFVYTAIDTLQVLWGLEGYKNSTKSWIQTLRDLEMNFLIV